MTEEIEIPLASTDKYEEALAKARFEYKENPCATEGEKKLLEIIFPELAESDDERIRKELLAVINDLVLPDEQKARFNSYLEKQKDDCNRKLSLFEIERDKWYVCIKDFYANGKMQHSKGDLVRAKGGMRIMSLDRGRAAEYFFPVNDTKETLPVNKDLDKAAQEYEDSLGYYECMNQFPNVAFIAGAKWQEKQKEQKPAEWSEEEKEIEL